MYAGMQASKQAGKKTSSHILICKLNSLQANEMFPHPDFGNDWVAWWIIINLHFLLPSFLLNHLFACQYMHDICCEGIWYSTKEKKRKKCNLLSSHYPTHFFSSWFPLCIYYVRTFLITEPNWMLLQYHGRWRQVLHPKKINIIKKLLMKTSVQCLEFKTYDVFQEKSTKKTLWIFEYQQKQRKAKQTQKAKAGLKRASFVK